MNDILEGLLYCHNEGVVHCDIKLENLLTNKEDDDGVPIVKLCDFGLSHVKNKENGKIYMQRKSGSYSYIAPEVSNVSVYH